LPASRVALFKAALRPADARRTAATGEVRRLTRDAAMVLSDWHHFAILELVRLKSFRADSRWIARVLDLSVDDVNTALQRLLRLELLEMATKGRWIDRSGDAAASLEDFTHAAVRKLFDRMKRIDEEDQRMANAVARWQILAKDPEAVSGFYAKLFGWKVDA